MPERPSSRQKTPSPLLPAAEIKESGNRTPEYTAQQAGLEIERPRSALHSGDFRQEKDTGKRGDESTVLATSPVVPWHENFPTAALGPPRNDLQYSFRDTTQDSQLSNRSRAVSHSSFSRSPSFVFMAPTSPLVHQSNNPDLDFSQKPPPRQISRSPEHNSRRHTFSPRSLQTFRTSSDLSSVYRNSVDRPLPSVRREGTFPYQAHQPRRSLTNMAGFHASSTPQTPLLRPRRPSAFAEANPLHHAPMVGSYEESILRGRMSTTPSGPLDFVAQIGVLGKGDCKSNLRCPSHVTVPFPAVFYSYGSGNGRISDDQPSPYVGMIDLEHMLKPAEEFGESRKRRKYGTPSGDVEDSVPSAGADGDSDARAKTANRRREKMKRRSASPKAPPGGSYRIPQQGQLQIVIKNPNKTAVKLFLVPYDLSDMGPGQKTFIRQRSYSAGPIIDMPMASRKNLGTDRPEASLSNSDDPNDRPVLRYLIHLNVCCPSKGRFFLYNSVRVVFANRVPDGKEKLRNEIQSPEPRYSSYKPSKTPLSASHAMSYTAAGLTGEKVLMRGGVRVSSVQDRLDAADGLSFTDRPPTVANTWTPYSPTDRYSSQPVAPIPFTLVRLATVESRPGSRDADAMDLGSPFTTTRLASSPDHPSPAFPLSGGGSASRSMLASRVCSSSDTGNGSYGKLCPGDNGYGGNAFGAPSSGTTPAAGLLARRLRELDVEP